MDTEICATASSGTAIVRPSAKAHAERTRIEWDICLMVIASLGRGGTRYCGRSSPISNSNTHATRVSGRYRTQDAPSAPRRNTRIALSALIAGESGVMVGSNSLPAATEQKANEQSDRRGNTYGPPRLFAHIA